MKGTDCYGSPAQYPLDSTQEFTGDAATAAEIEAQLILGLAKNLGVDTSNTNPCNDLYGVAERLAGLLQNDLEDDDEEDEDAEQGEYPNDVDQVIAGYSGCMREALRYLIEEEGLSPTHPIVQGLANHLLSQQQLLAQELSQQQQDCNNTQLCDR